MRAILVAVVVAIASPVSAATIHGLVFDDTNGDGRPSAGERGVANAVVAFGVEKFVVTDASGQFDLTMRDLPPGIVWVRVPDGFTPGPVWANWTGSGDVDLALHRLPAPIRGPVTFVVAADSHLPITQAYFGAADLATVAAEATALDPPPAFFTILGDITQGNKDEEFALADSALADLGVPWIPVPGNHDWYDNGAAWFKHYGPDNYSFDIANVHFVVWNMAMSEDDIRAYLGAELKRVARAMTIVALTHAPPSVAVIDALRELHVDYVLTGHAHSNRVVDHDGVIELNTEPLLMGGLDFTPAGYRVITIAGKQLSSYHRTVVEQPYLAVIAPARGQCTPAIGAQLLAAAELDAGASNVTARVDCATPFALRWVGGWTWRGDLGKLDPGSHEISVDAISSTGGHAIATATIEVCDPGPPPSTGDNWAQVGGGAAHTGARAHELAPPLVTRWTAAVGGHVITAAPVIADGAVYVATSDLGDGNAGSVVAIDLASGAIRWRVTTPVTVRGGVAVEGTTVIAAQIDGVVLGLDTATGAVRWRYELSAGFAPQTGAVFAPPSVDDGDVMIGHQRNLAVLSAASGVPSWSADPVPDGVDSQTAAAIAIADGIAVGTFNRAIGGVIAWDRATGAKLWQVDDDSTIAINASPVIANETVYIVNGDDVVMALDLASGALRWRAALDPAGFDWGNATIGTPAIANDVLVVPTLYRDLVALDPSSGTELWRHAATPGPLRTTHYRGAHEAGYEASPIITSGIVWAVDTSGELVALDLQRGELLWTTELDVPVLAGLATTGDWLIAASYDGTVRALTPIAHEREAAVVASCTEPPPSGGCCDATGAPGTWALTLIVAAALLRRRA